MESIIFGLIGLFSRLNSPWNNLIASVRGVFAKWSSRVADLVEPTTGMALWCVPPIFWTIVIYFVVKHR
jgi:hypothetical protein